MEDLIKKHIHACYVKDSIAKSIEQEIKDLQEHKSQCLECIKEYLQNPEVKAFIDQKLVEGNEKFELDKNKGKVDEQKLVTECTTKTRDSGYKKEKYEHKNPRGKFIPSNDEYVIIKVEKNDSGEYKITVDNIKGRQYIGAFNWIPDEYYTDWFSI